MTDKESPADRVKREAAEKAEQEKLDAEKAALEQAAAKEAEGIAADAARDKAAAEQKARDAAIAGDKAAAEQKARDAAIAGEEDGSRPDPAAGLGEPIDLFSDELLSRRDLDIDATREAHDTLFKIAQSYPLTTPDEHTIFGFGGFKFTVGQLRSLFQLQRAR